MQMTDYQTFIHQSKYARWDDVKMRRETWDETIARVVNFWRQEQPEVVTDELALELYDAMYALDAVGSMRTMMTAGEALRRDHVSGYNCAYMEMDKLSRYTEMMYALMCGTGVGLTVERECVKKLPILPDHLDVTDEVHVVGDSKYGWVRATKELINALYDGRIIKMDYSKVRPAGARLKTFGGRASGYEPLEDLHKFITNKVRENIENDRKRMSDEDVADIACKIGEIVVVGGVRRSALIILTSPVSARMRDYKTGEWWTRNDHRRLANISSSYEEKPDFRFFMDEMTALFKSYSGERGLFSREACNNIASMNGRRKTGYRWGCNPCSEIILRPQEFC